MKLLNRNLILYHEKNEESLLMLDYDGTLAPFVRNRMKARPYKGVKQRLTKLLKIGKTRVVIISGRSLDDLETLLGKPQHLELWGSHGFERKLVNGKRILSEIDANTREGLKLGIDICLKQAPHKFCEAKPFSVALHFRGMKNSDKDEILPSVKACWNKLAKNYGLKVRPFEEGLELMPRGTTKGDAVKQIIKELQNPNIPIAYLGDDITDEDAFKALGKKGLKVLVRKQLRPTLADLQIEPPQELLNFLDLWIEHYE